MHINNINYLTEFSNEIVEVQSIKNKKNVASYINNLKVVEIESEIILEDGEPEANVKTIHIPKSLIVDIEQNYDGQTVIYMLQGKIILNRL